MHVDDIKPDWVGTPRKHSYEENGIIHTAISIDFSLRGDDTRYKLVIQIEGENKRYEIKQYGSIKGAQKPFLKDTDYRYENKTSPLIDAILSDPYVQYFL
ncbi:DUF3910 family protein [Ectobacillus sp. sgz5001026]|uniref:DUF3910 family protein n=1 Tax=Ectobacillus sp. sgz5001026 TaxID=3242473 RepID=UPI0036D3FABC